MKPLELMVSLLSLKSGTFLTLTPTMSNLDGKIDATAILRKIKHTGLPTVHVNTQSTIATAITTMQKRLVCNGLEQGV